MNTDFLYHLLPTRLNLRILLLGFVFVGGLLVTTSKALAEPSISPSQPAAESSFVLTKTLFEELFENREPLPESNVIRPETPRSDVFRLPEALREAFEQAAVSLAGSRGVPTNGGGEQ